MPKSKKPSKEEIIKRDAYAKGLQDGETYALWDTACYINKNYTGQNEKQILENILRTAQLFSEDYINEIMNRTEQTTNDQKLYNAFE